MTHRNVPPPPPPQGTPFAYGTHVQPLWPFAAAIGLLCLSSAGLALTLLRPAAQQNVWYSDPVFWLGTVAFLTFVLVIVLFVSRRTLHRRMQTAILVSLILHVMVAMLLKEQILAVVVARQEQPQSREVPPVPTMPDYFLPAPNETRATQPFDRPSDASFRGELSSLSRAQPTQSIEAQPRQSELDSPTAQVNQDVQLQRQPMSVARRADSPSQLSRQSNTLASRQPENITAPQPSRSRPSRSHSRRRTRQPQPSAASSANSRQSAPAANARRPSSRSATLDRQMATANISDRRSGAPTERRNTARTEMQRTSTNARDTSATARLSPTQSQAEQLESRAAQSQPTSVRDRLQPTTDTLSRSTRRTPQRRESSFQPADEATAESPSVTEASPFPLSPSRRSPRTPPSQSIASDTARQPRRTISPSALAETNEPQNIALPNQAAVSASNSTTRSEIAPTATGGVRRTELAGPPSRSNRNGNPGQRSGTSSAGNESQPSTAELASRANLDTFGQSRSRSRRRRSQSESASNDGNGLDGRADALSRNEASAAQIADAPIELGNIASASSDRGGSSRSSGNDGGDSGGNDAVGQIGPSASNSEGVARASASVPTRVAAAEGTGGLARQFAPEAGIPDRRARPRARIAHTNPGRFLQDATAPARSRQLAELGQQARRASNPFAGRVARREAGGGDNPATGAPSAETEAMIERGLVYLAKVQHEDGRWSFQGGRDPQEQSPLIISDTAASGLALLAFLGAGYDHFEGQYQANVRSGIGWLVERQQANGDLYVRQNGPANQGIWLYSHGIAAIALCEAYGMTGDENLRRPAQQALNFIVNSQHPTYGGWRYTPGATPDLSVSGWQLMAMRSGQLAGLRVPEDAFAKVRKLLDYTHAGRSTFVYSPWSNDPRRAQVDRSPTAVMTSVGLLMRLYTGSGREDAEIKRGARLLSERLPNGRSSRPIRSMQNPNRDAYYWYNATQVMFHMQDQRWDAWREALYSLLADSQQLTGKMAGSWDPFGESPDRWARLAGRLYVTTMNLLSLEVYYRHLPLYDDGLAAP